MNKINAVRVSDIFLEALDTPSSAFHGSWFLLLFFVGHPVILLLMQAEEKTFL